MNTAEHDEHEHPVESRADAAENDFAKLNVEQRHEAAQRREGIVHGVDRAARGVRRDRGEQRGVEDAEADFFAFHVAIGGGEAELLMDRIAIGLGPPAEDARRRGTARSSRLHTAQPCFWFLTMRPK